MSLKKFLEVQIDTENVDRLEDKAREKIKKEGWPLWPPELKADNFRLGWISEIAWKTILDNSNISYHWAGTYIGPAQDAPLDFRMSFDNIERTVGVRSRLLDKLERYRQVPYPDDRFRNEHERIEAFTLAASVLFNDAGAIVRFYGAIEKEELIWMLGRAERRLSKKQKQYFRPVDLRVFSFELMTNLLNRADRR